MSGQLILHFDVEHLLTNCRSVPSCAFSAA